MSDTIRSDKEEALQSAGHRKRSILFAYIGASPLIVIMVAAFVMHMRPSPAERLRRDLLDAILENDRERYMDSVQSVQNIGPVSDYSFRFRNEEERKAMQDAQALKLQIWLDEEVTLWNDEKLEKRSIVSTVLTSGSSKWGGTGLADSDEGFDLVERAIAKLEAKYPLTYPTRMFITRDPDGTVAIGTRTPSRRGRRNPNP